MQGVEGGVAAWDFRGALAELEKVHVEDDPVLVARLAARRGEIIRMGRLKVRIVAAINQAEPPLDKRSLLLKGINGPVRGADEEGITAEVAGGKAERHLWGQLSEKSLEKVVLLGVGADAAEDWVAGGLLALVARVPGLAERCFGEAAKLGAKVEEYAGPLAEAALAGADEDLRQAEGLLVAGREALAAGKLPEAAKAFSQAEKRYRQAESALAELASKYGQAEWYRTGKVAVEAARQTARRGVVETEAERLYLEAAAAFTRNELFDVKPLVDKLKGEYGGTPAVTDTGRKPSFAEFEKATANLGKRLTVRKDGKGDFTSIQAAIDAAPARSLVEIEDSVVYDEKIYIAEDKTDLILRGKRGAWPMIISMPPKQPFVDLVKIYATGVSLENLVIVHKCSPGGLDGEDGLLFGAPGRLRRCIVFPAIRYGGKLVMEQCICGRCDAQGGPLHCRDSIWMAFPAYIPHISEFRNVLFLGGDRGIGSASVFERCTVVGHVKCADGAEFRDSILVSIRSGRRTVVEFCCLTGTPPFIDDVRPGKGCFSAKVGFRDPANLDYRLMPGSPCIGKASDGGDIGCRYTPEMIDLCKVALELRRRGIIKF